MMGVTRQQHSLTEEGYSERFKVARRLIQIHSAKPWAFHIPTMFLQRTIGRTSWHSNHVFYYGLLSVMASGQQRPRSPLIHINSANATVYTSSSMSSKGTECRRCWRAQNQCEPSLYYGIIELIIDLFTCCKWLITGAHIWWISASKSLMLCPDHKSITDMPVSPFGTYHINNSTICVM